MVSKFSTRVAYSLALIDYMRTYLKDVMISAWRMPWFRFWPFKILIHAIFQWKDLLETRKIVLIIRQSCWYDSVKLICVEFVDCSPLGLKGIYVKQFISRWIQKTSFSKFYFRVKFASLLQFPVVTILDLAHLVLILVGITYFAFNIVF